MLTKERLLHPATIIATAALLVALSGAGYAATKIGTAQLKNNAVTTPKIKNNAVTTAKIRAGAVRAADIGGGAVDTPGLANNAVTAAKIANGSVGTEKLANGSVTSLKLANGSVGTPELGRNAVTGANIAGGTVTAANIAPGQLVTGRGQVLSARVDLGPAATGPTTLLALPGIATFTVDCTPAGANTRVTNTAGKIISSTVSGIDAGGPAFVDETPLALGAVDVLANAGTGGLQAATWQLHSPGAAIHVATVQVSANGTSAPGPGCTVGAQAVSTG